MLARAFLFCPSFFVLPWLFLFCRDLLVLPWLFYFALNFSFCCYCFALPWFLLCHDLLFCLGFLVLPWLFGFAVTLMGHRIRQIEWLLQNGPITKSGVLPVTTSFFWKTCSSFRTSIFVFFVRAGVRVLFPCEFP